MARAQTPEPEREAQRCWLLDHGEPSEATFGSASEPGCSGFPQAAGAFPVVIKANSSRAFVDN